MHWSYPSLEREGELTLCPLLSQYLQGLVIWIGSSLWRLFTKCFIGSKTRGDSCWLIEPTVQIKKVPKPGKKWEEENEDIWLIMESACKKSGTWTWLNNADRRLGKGVMLPKDCAWYKYEGEFVSRRAYSLWNL